MKSDREQLDSADIDALKELQRSAGYALVEGRIREELARRQSNLEDLCTPQLTDTLRGQITALRTVLTIPQILIDEFKKQ